MRAASYFQEPFGFNESRAITDRFFLVCKSWQVVLILGINLDTVGALACLWIRIACGEIRICWMCFQVG